jgi:acyl-CoA synthetase (AMP-forming)/AMP-acid ligase II
VQAVRDRSVGGPARGIVVQPLFHMNGLFQSKTVFATHGSIVMLPAFDPRTYLQAIAGWGVTAVMAVPTMLARALKETDLVAALDFSAVRLVRVGSAPVTQALLDRIAAAFPNAVVANGYGTTEAGPNVFGPHPDGRPTPMLSVGAALPGAEVELVPTGDDPDQGVLRMRNPAVMTGYLNMPAASAKVLQDGWYNSGDVFRRDEAGFYYFVGRADDMFVCSGENIYPADVEKMLERHTAIHTACVVPLPDEERGQMPVAFVVPRPGASLAAAEVKQFALAHGPAYQHPRRVAFVSDLPWAGTNKIDRNALLARAKTLEAEGGWST